MNKYQQYKLEMAIAYVDRGWAVIPVGYNKIPLIQDWPINWSKDAYQILEWFKQYPTMNIDIVTGKVSGFFAVDVDNKSHPTGNESITKAYGDIFDFDAKKYLAAETPSDGYHLLISTEGLDDVKTCTKVLPSVDIRGEGGQIVISPSSFNVKGEWKQYRWNNFELPISKATEWSLDIIKRGGEARKRTYNLETALTGLSEGERDEGLFNFALMMKKNNIPEALAMEFIKVAASRCLPAFEEEIALMKVQSAYSYTSEKKGNAKMEKLRKAYM
jgi:hypothetical protein